MNAPASRGRGTPLGQLPPLDAADLERRVGNREPAVFLDYDGTLTAIVDDPADATLPPATRVAIERLRERCTVAIVSGRDLQDVRKMVGIDGIHYAGSHGFDILTPEGERHQRGTDYLPALEAAEQQLEDDLGAIPGVRIERKRFAIAVHDRHVPEGRLDEVASLITAVAAQQPRLQVTGGKRIHELRPDIEWDKGRALRWLLEQLDLAGPDVVPIYVGDDVTDEDAFEALGDDGIAVVVQGEDDTRPSAADVRLEDPDDARVLLEMLVSLLDGRGS